MFNRLIYILLPFLLIVRISSASPASSSLVKSLFASGKWIKIETSSIGVHKIYYSWLKNNGFSHPENVRIFGSRNEAMVIHGGSEMENMPVQVPVMPFTDVNGASSLLFYVQGAVSWRYDLASGQYSRVSNQAARGKSYFFLTEDAGVESFVPSADSGLSNPDFTVTSYDDMQLWEEENLNLIESGSRWFTALLSGGNLLKKTFSFPDRLEKEGCMISLYAAGRSLSATSGEISANGSVLGNLQFSGVQQVTGSDFAVQDSLKANRLLSGADISVAMKYNGSIPGQCWLDYATVQVRRSLKYNGTPLLFRDGRSLGKGKMAEYQIGGALPGLKIWDVTNPLSPVQINFSTLSGQITFRAGCDSLRNFLLFEPSATWPGVSKSADVLNVDLLNSDAPAYLIITPAQFRDQAERLAAFHRMEEGMTVRVENIESIFDGLSGGYPDIVAIRNYVKHLLSLKAASKGSPLKYLLLFGKGTMDPVHDAGENNPNWIPSFQSENSLNSVNSFVTDDFFGMPGTGENVFGGNLEIGIGRIPALTKTEAAVAVEKIIHYRDVQTLGEWRNRLAFIGDDEDNNLHVKDSETLVALVNDKNPEYLTSRIYLDSYPQLQNPDESYPAVNEAIRRSVETGNLMVNYVGHASEDGLAHERVMTVSDIDALKNKNRLPLFITATCEFSRWDMVMKRSAGEHLLFNPNGGAIALLSATRLVYSASNLEVNRSFFKHAFDKDDSGAHLRLGDLIRLVKNENSGTVNTLKFCLLGDPALRLNYPEKSVVNLEINKVPVGQFAGTVAPLSLVTVSGEIRDQQGSRLAMASGTLTATVYDQPAEAKTLGNGGLPPFLFQVRENILFNGSVGVRNGSFTYSFVVPKEVNFNSGAGLIRYYYNDGKTDGNGSFADIHFNGNAVPGVNDLTGPTLSIFLENEEFKEGGTVSAHPLLLVSLSDESGICSSGIGIGHDIVLELDGNTTAPFVLNDYYRSDTDGWKSGSISFQLPSLSAGPHAVKLKVWDNANNSSVAIVGFNVNNDLNVRDLYNYPNPFSDQTTFVVTHNRYNEVMDVTLEIMDLSGRIVSSTIRQCVSDGNVIRELTWVPGQTFPVPACGIYLYRFSLTDREGKTIYRSGRLIWIK